MMSVIALRFKISLSFLCFYEFRCDQSNEIDTAKGIRFLFYRRAKVSDRELIRR